MDIKIIVAAHKEYTMPQDDIYIPIHVGAKGKADIGYTRDDSGDNISDKNRGFCELTGIYWAWKNLEADYVGLVHYRRLFGTKKSLLTKKELLPLLQKTDIILPKKRNYYIETLHSHYVNTLYREPLDIAFDIIKDKYPDYYPEMQNLKNRKSAHMFNMFIMKRELFDSYCEFLFPILFELEHRTKDISYDDFHARYFGRISELLLDVWINTNKHKYTEYPFVYTEKVNLFKKGASFLMAKFFKKKYGKSF